MILSYNIGLNSFRRFCGTDLLGNVNVHFLLHRTMILSYDIVLIHGGLVTKPLPEPMLTGHHWGQAGAN